MSDNLITLLCLMLIVIAISLIIIITLISMLLIEMLKKTKESTVVRSAGESHHYDHKPAEMKPKKIEPLMVPDLDPLALAPSLKNPPKAAGGFGTKTEKNDT